MSALGQKQTFAVQNVMSALPPIADMCSARVHVRFVPIADIIRLWDDTHSAGGLRECAELSEKKVQSIGPRRCRASSLPARTGDLDDPRMKKAGRP